MFITTHKCVATRTHARAQGTYTYTPAHACTDTHRHTRIYAHTRIKNIHIQTHA